MKAVYNIRILVLQFACNIQDIEQFAVEKTMTTKSTVCAGDFETKASTSPLLIRLNKGSI